MSPSPNPGPDHDVPRSGNELHDAVLRITAQATQQAIQSADRAVHQPATHTIFRQLPVELAAELREACSVHVLREGAILAQSSGDATIDLIVEGLIAVRFVNPALSDVQIELRGRDDIIGEEYLAPDPAGIVRVVMSHVESTVLRVPAYQLVQILSRNPVGAQQLLMLMQRAAATSLERLCVELGRSRDTGKPRRSPTSP